MRKAALVLAGLILILVVAVVLVPRFVGLNALKPQIAEAVRDATGRDLTIEGDITLAIIPDVAFSLTDVRLSNPPGMSQADMLSLRAIEGDIALLPLLSGRVEVERLVLSDPVVSLEKNADGRANWQLAPAGAATGQPQEGAGGGAGQGQAQGQEVVLHDVRIEGGRISYLDASSGQSLEIEGVAVAVAMPAPQAPLTANGKLSLNGEPVTLDVSLDSLTKLQTGSKAELGAEIVSKLVTFDYRGAIQQQPVPGLDGDMNLAVGSLGALAAWLGQPLDPAQPDPGPLKLTARFAADQGRVALERAVLEGEALKATAQGSFESAGGVTKVAFSLDSSLIDVDRYLPSPTAAPAAATAEPAGAQATTAAQAERPKDLLTLLPDTPIDLSALRGTEADVSISLEGIKGMGYQTGPLVLEGVLSNGVLEARVTELSLYGGSLRGAVTLDGAGDALGVVTDLTIETVDVGALARVSMGDDAPVGGIASGTLKASARGTSPRGLAEALSAKLALDLGGLEVDDPAAADLSALQLAVDLPAMDQPSVVTASAVYKQEQVDVTLTVTPARAALAGEPFALEAAIDSALVDGGYRGRVQQQPIPGLDGELKLDVASVARLAAWLGNPLAAEQPDPGPLGVTASFAADQGKVALERAAITGEQLQATASGSIDTSSDITVIRLAVDAGALDIDRYLPPPAPMAENETAAPVAAGEPAPGEPTPGEPGAGRDLLAGLSEEPIDLGPLFGTDAEVSITLAGLKAMGYEVGPVVLAGTLREGVLEADIRELALYGGTVRGSVDLDSADSQLGVAVDLAIDKVDVGALARAAQPDQEAAIAGIASGKLDATAKGASPRALAESLAAQLSLDLGGVEIADAAAGQLSALSVALDLPGMTAPTALTGSAVYNQETVTLDLSLAPLTTILAGEPFDLNAKLASGLIAAAWQGRVQQQPVPGLDGDLEVDIGSVGKLAAWLGQPLDAAQPDPGPLKLSASFAADEGKVALERASIEGEAISATAKGSVEITGDVTKVTLDVDAGRLDVDRYLPQPKPGAMAAPVETAGEASKAGPPDLLAGLSEEPFDLSGLRNTEADVSVSLAGIKAQGYEVGRVVLALLLKQGVLDAELKEVALYGGTVSGTTRLDGATDLLGVKTAMTIDKVDVGAFARAAQPAAEPAVGGLASGSLNAEAAGANPRALAEALSAQLRLDLGGVTIADPSAAGLSELKLALDLPGASAASTLSGSAVYKQERVDVGASLAPLATILAGETFDLTAEVHSALLNAAYQGKIRQQPLPGLDGDLNLDVGSVGKLAAWLGQPLDPAQPDPGPLTVDASFAADDKGVIALESATIEGEALKATAKGSFDGSGAVKVVRLDVEADRLDIDRYLPPPAAGGVAAAPESLDSSGIGERSNPLAALSDEPFDLAGLRGTDAEVSVSLNGIKAKGYEIGRVLLALILKEGVLDADLKELALYGGTLRGTTRLDGAGELLGVATDLVIDKVDVGALARAAHPGQEPPVSGVASGSLSAKASGASPRALIEALSAQADLDLGGVSVADPAAKGLSALTVSLDLPGLAADSKLVGSAVYNKERVDLDLGLAPLGTILAGETFALKAKVASKLATASYQGKVQQQPLFGLDGDLAADVASVGKLAAWLGQPLAADQPDPGPVKLNAKLTADQGKVSLQQARIEGAGLNATAKGSFDASGETRRLKLDIEGGVLDLDRYLPKAPPAAEPPATKEQRSEGGGTLDLLEGLSDAPLDLGALKSTDAELSLKLQGLKAKGYELGRVVLAALIKGGVLSTEIKELALYGGTVKGTARVDGSGTTPAVATDLTVAKVDVGALGRVAMGKDPPVAGVASGSLSAKAQGKSPRALARNLSARLEADLGGIESSEPAAADISEARLTLDLPGLEARSKVTGRIVYKKQPLDFDLDMAPVGKVLGGETIDLTARLVSALVTAGYQGLVQQRPTLGLDGDLALDIASVGKLAAWLDKPLDPKQPDPGPLKVNASFATDQSRIAIEQAVIEGRAADARARGSYDPEAYRFDGALAVANLDLDAYLPPPEAAPAKSGGAPAADTGWSREPFDLTWLKQGSGDVKVEIARARYRGLDVTDGRATLILKDGRLSARIERLALSGGSVAGALDVDGASGKAADVSYDLTVSNVEARPLLRAFADSDRLSGKLQFATQGRANGASEQQIVESLDGNGRFAFTDGAIHGIDVAAALRQVGSLGIGGGETRKTDFSELSGSFDIQDGLLVNQDLKMLAPLVRVTGAGSVPLPPRTVDYLVEAKLVGTLQGQGGQEALAGLPIPIRITGPWSNVSYTPDFGAVLQQALQDPTRLANMPNELLDSAKGLGLTIPGLGEGASGGAIGKVLEGLGGAGQGSAGGDGQGGAAGALQTILPGLLGTKGGGGTPAAVPPAAAPTGPAPTGPAPSGPAPSRSATVEQPLQQQPQQLQQPSVAPAPSGPAPSGPAPSRPAPAGPAPATGQQQQQQPGLNNLLQNLLKNN